MNFRMETWSAALHPQACLDDLATYAFDMAMGSNTLATVMEGKQTRQK